MTEKQKILAATEQFVRDVLSKDLKQTNVPNSVVRDVAKKIVKDLPVHKEVTKEKTAA